jgi:predicted PurR-regulated permease PerM
MPRFAAIILLIISIVVLVASVYRLSLSSSGVVTRPPVVNDVPTTDAQDEPQAEPQSPGSTPKPQRKPKSQVGIINTILNIAGDARVQGLVSIIASTGTLIVSILSLRKKRTTEGIEH